MENKPPVADLANAVKRGLIRTCPICDGYEHIGKHIAVLGNGEHAAAEALFLRTYTDKLSLFLIATQTAALSQDTQRRLDAAGIRLAHMAAGTVGIGNDGVTILSAEDGQTHR